MFTQKCVKSKQETTVSFPLCIAQTEAENDKARWRASFLCLPGTMATTLACITTVYIYTDALKVKVHTLDIAPLRGESPPQKRSGKARRVLKGFHSFTCTPTRSSAIGISHTCLCLPSYSWYSFADPGGMEG